MSEAAVIMAAGKGTRMNSDLPKVLHLAAGKPLVHWVVEACRTAGLQDIVVVVGYKEHLVRASLAEQGVRFVTQHEQKGTGHAAAQAAPALAGLEGRAFVLNGDCPLITAPVIEAMRAAHVAAAADATLLYVAPEQPLEYGRLIRKDNGEVVDVIEERDCTAEQKRIRELNAGFYVFNAPAVWTALASLSNSNQAGEYYITDVARFYGRDGKVVAVKAPDEMALGVNTPEQLRQVEATLLGRGLARSN